MTQSEAGPPADEQPFMAYWRIINARTANTISEQLTLATEQQSLLTFEPETPLHATILQPSIFTYVRRERPDFGQLAPDYIDELLRQRIGRLGSHSLPLTIKAIGLSRTKSNPNRMKYFARLEPNELLVRERQVMCEGLSRLTGLPVFPRPQMEVTLAHLNADEGHTQTAGSLRAALNRKLRGWVLPTAHISFIHRDWPGTRRPDQ
jgi:hypothetical protein